MIKSLSKLSALLMASMLVVAVMAVSALADTSYLAAGSFATAQGAGDGEVSDPQHVAVETSTGNVLLVDRGNNRVQVFAPDGSGSASYLAQFGAGVLDGPTGIAIDQSTGDVYVSDADDIVKFTTDGAPTPTYTQDGAFTSPGLTGSLAFDQNASQLLVANADHVRRYGTSGTAGTTFDGSDSGAAFTNLKDIAVQDDGDIVVIDEARAVRFEDDNSYAATITGLPGTPDLVTAVPGTDNLLFGHIGGYNADFTKLLKADLYRTSGDAYHATTSPGESVYGFRGLAVSGTAGHELYAVTAGEWFGGAPGVTAYAPFAVQLPAVSDVSASPTEIGARLKGTVDPRQDATAWSFEYGTTTDYGKRFPTTGSVQAGGSPVSVQTTIGGLQPGTLYHYRLVATNGAGSTASADRTFTTQAAGAPEPGERDSGRAYEQVSPPDKNGTDPYPKFTVGVSDSGDRVLFTSSGSFAGGAASLLLSYYGSDRTAGNWTTTNLDPPVTNDRFQYAASTRAASSDLRFVIQGSNHALAPGAVDGAGNVYLLDRQTGSSSSDRHRLERLRRRIRGARQLPTDHRCVGRLLAHPVRVELRPHRRCG